MAVVDHLHGATITFGSSFFGTIRNIAHQGVTRPDVDVTHSATTGARAYIPGDLYEGGTFQIDGLLDETKNFTTPITAAAETTTITLPVASGQTTAMAFAFSGYMNSWSMDGDTADGGTPATFSASIKVASGVTVTTAA